MSGRGGIISIFGPRNPELRQSYSLISQPGLINFHPESMSRSAGCANENRVGELYDGSKTSVGIC